jgi:hypothetical protein
MEEKMCHLQAPTFEIAFVDLAALAELVAVDSFIYCDDDLYADSSLKSAAAFTVLL